MPLSPNIGRLEPSATIAVSSLAKRLKAQGRDIIDLSAGEPDYDTPTWVSRAAIDGIEAGKIRYTATAGLPELRKAIAKVLSQRAGRELAWEGVVVSGGAKQALFNACFSLFGPEDEVLIASPYWTSYPEIVKLARAEPVTVAGREDREFRVTPADLDAVRTPKTKGLIYSSPCNPTGSVYSLEELTALAEWASSHGIWLIADEIYRQIFYEGEGEAPGLLDLPQEALSSFVLIDGASKSYAMTGWRLGFSWCEPEIAAELSALQSHTTSNPATPSQLAAIAAFSDPDRIGQDVARMGEGFKRRRDLVVRLFQELLPELSFVPPRGAFYLFFKVDALFGDGLASATEVCSWLLEEAGVALVPGAAFGDDRWVRMSFAASDEELEGAVRRISEAVATRASLGRV